MSLSEAILFSIMLAVGFALLLWTLPVRLAWARGLVVFVVLVITGNYTIWRISALPALEWVAGSLWPWAFFVMEFATIAYEVWTYGVIVRRSDHSSEASLYELHLRAGVRLPSVDVFIATYNEPLAILEQTILAAKRLDYPGHLLRIIVGDDGDRKALECLTRSLGVDYMARPIQPGSASNLAKVGGKGKGGNDRYTFAHSDGEYILLLDADFSVRPEFLYRTLGFLLFRADVGLVQTPQRFFNPDVIGHNLLAGDCVPEDQHFFMCITQPSRDAWGNAFCTGTACLVSRRALRQLNPEFGFPDTTICEDLELSYALLGIGYRTLYLNEPLASGLAPETIPDFLKQRVRWCTGTVQNLYAPTGPFRGNLSLRDRLFYCEGVFYWLGFIFTAMLLLAPVVFWFSGLSAVLGTPEAAAAAVFPRLIVRELAMYWLSEGKISPLVVQVSRALPAFHVTAAFLHGLLRPKSSVFRVTNKGHSRDRTVVRWPLFAAFLAIASAVAYGMTAALLGRSQLAASSDLVQMNVAWSTITMLICVLCALACVEQPQVGVGGAEVVRSRPLGIACALARRTLGLGRRRGTTPVPGCETLVGGN